MKSKKDTLVIAKDKQEVSEIIKLLTKENRLSQVVYSSDINIIIDDNVNNIVCYDSLKLVSNYIENHTIKTLIIPAGFVGCNILKAETLQEKYKDKQVVKDNLLSEDIESTNKIFNSNVEQIQGIYMLSKNLPETINKQDIANEIIKIISNQELSFRYLSVNPYHDKETDTWGSELYLMFKAGRYRTIKTAIGVQQ